MLTQQNIDCHEKNCRIAAGFLESKNSGLTITQDLNCIVVNFRGYIVDCDNWHDAITTAKAIVNFYHFYNSGPKNG